MLHLWPWFSGHHPLADMRKTDLLGRTFRLTTKTTTTTWHSVSPASGRLDDDDDDDRNVMLLGTGENASARQPRVRFSDLEIPVNWVHGLTLTP